jgi:hypothetical protein
MRKRGRFSRLWDSEGRRLLIQLRRRSSEPTPEETKNAWDEYERGWQRLHSLDKLPVNTPLDIALLTFEAIPWPQTRRPKPLAELDLSKVAEFLLSPHHSAGVTSKARIRNAVSLVIFYLRASALSEIPSQMFRFHSDKFGF